MFHNFWLQTAVILIGMYLIGFQLFPLFNVFEENVFIHLYPLTLAQRSAAFSKLLQKVLLLALVVGIVSGQAAYFSLEGLVLQLGLGLVEVWILSKPFWRAHLRKNA